MLGFFLWLLVTVKLHLWHNVALIVHRLLLLRGLSSASIQCYKTLFALRHPSFRHPWQFGHFLLSTAGISENYFYLYFIPLFQTSILCWRAYADPPGWPPPICRWTGAAAFRSAGASYKTQKRICQVKVVNGFRVRRRGQKKRGYRTKEALLTAHSFRNGTGALYIRHAMVCAISQLADLHR